MAVAGLGLINFFITSIPLELPDTAEEFVLLAMLAALFILEAPGIINFCPIFKVFTSEILLVFNILDVFTS